MVDYRMLAEKPFVNMAEIGNALAVRQQLQEQPMRQMQAAAELERTRVQNRIAFMQEQQTANAEKVRQATIAAQMNAGIPEAQAVAGAANMPPPQNALAGMTSAPTAAPTPQGWRPPMALPPEGGNAFVAPAPRTPYSPEAEGRYNAQTQQKQIKLKQAMDVWYPLLVESIKSGSQSMTDAMLRAGKKSPALAEVVSFFGDPDGPENQRLVVPGKEETQTQSAFKSKEQIMAMLPMAANDIVKASMEAAGPGTYEVDTKGFIQVGGRQVPKITKFKAVAAANKIAGLDPTDNKPVHQDDQGNLVKDGAPYTGGQLLPLTETRDQKSFDEQSAFKPVLDNKLADFVAKNNRQPSPYEKNILTRDAWQEVVKTKAQFTAPTILAGTVPGQPGTGITFTGRGGEGKAGTVPLPGGGMTGKEQKPLSEKAQEDLTSSFQGLDILQTLKNTVGESGRVKGLFSKAGAWLGTNEDAVKFNTSRQQMWLMAQSAVKGIPSDKDMSMVMNSVPELWEPENVNTERIKIFERIFKNAIAAKISMYKGSNTIIPPEVIALAKSKGIAIDSVKPWDEVTPFNLMQGIDEKSIGGTGVQKLVKKDGKWAPATPEKK